MGARLNRTFEDARKRGCRPPGRWWWIRLVTGVAVLGWRTALLALTWQH